jgi:hypothetical protein
MLELVSSVSWFQVRVIDGNDDNSVPFLFESCKVVGTLTLVCWVLIATFVADNVHARRMHRPAVVHKNVRIICR